MQRLSNIQVQAGGTALMNKSYTYDTVGNVSTILNSALSPTQTSTYTYDHRDRLTRWQVNSSPGIDQNYYYDVMGNFTNKAGVGYGYIYGSLAGAGGPYAVRNTGFSYDQNGNMLTDPNSRTYTWTAENLPDTISYPGPVGPPLVEQYTYDAEGERVHKTKGTDSTYYFGGLYEEESATSLQRYYYTFSGQTVAQRENVPSGKGIVTTVKYIHEDHLGSVSLMTNGSGVVGAIGNQEFDPWGKVRTDVGATVGTQTRMNFTGQKLDDSGLLYYHARMYDPGWGRFVSPDSIVPGASSGIGGAGGSVGQEQNSRLTVDFNESGFASSIAGENALTLQKGFWFQLSGDDKQKASVPWGPANPQSLDRYTYVLNNPLRYVDPTGHFLLTYNYMGPSSILPRGFSLVLSHNEFGTLLDALKLGKSIAAAFLGAIGAGAAPEAPWIGFLVAILTDYTIDHTIIAALQKLYDAGGTLEFYADPGLWLLTGSAAAVRLVTPEEAKALDVQDGIHLAERRDCADGPICTAPRHYIRVPTGGGAD